MTAKELKECAAVYMSGDDNTAILHRYIFKDYELEAFCETLCREQRDICADESDKNAWIDETVKPVQIFVDKEDVLNAESPEL